MFAYGARHARIKSAETSTLLALLFQGYRLGVQAMPDVLEEFTRETIDQMLREIPVQKRLEGLTAEELLAALSPETREELARRLHPEQPPNPESQH